MNITGVPSINQYYVALKALNLQKAPVRIGEITDSMKSVSKKLFGKELFVYNPVALSDLFEEMNRNGDVRFNRDDATVAITGQGKMELANTMPLIVQEHC